MSNVKEDKFGNSRSCDLSEYGDLAVRAKNLRESKASSGGRFAKKSTRKRDDVGKGRGRPRASSRGGSFRSGDRDSSSRGGSFRSGDRDSSSRGGSFRSGDRDSSSRGGSFRSGDRDSSSRGGSFRSGDRFSSVRIAKKLADLGYCSRRDAERFVQDGRVKINGVVVKDLSFQIDLNDSIKVNGRDIPNKVIPIKVYLFHKPAGYVTTTRDPEGRRTVFDIIPTKFGRLITIGRLDYNSEGLLILTNNGDYARQMELPSSRVKREYIVLVSGDVNMDDMHKLKDGIEIDDFWYNSMEVKLDKKIHDTETRLRIAIHEGKNREIRRVMAHFGLKVLQLVRIQYGKYYLSGVPKGCVIEYRGRV